MKAIANCVVQPLTKKMEKTKYKFPDGYSFLRTILNSREFLSSPIEFIGKSMNAFSGTYTARIGLRRKLIVTQDAGLINHILKDNHRNYSKSELMSERAVEFLGGGLLFSNGEYWLRQRRLIQPAFHRQKLEGLYDIMVKSIEEFVGDFPVDASIDVYPLACQASFKLLIESLFDIKIPDAVIGELREIFTELQDFLMKDINSPSGKLFYPFTGEEKKQRKRAKRLREICGGLIADRRRSDKEYNDLLDMLLNSRYEDSGETMGDEQLIDEVLILIFAGHETTGNTIAWLLYLLASNQDELQKLRVVLAETNVTDCLNNEYLRAVINEGMRLYPAAWMTERVALKDDAFGDFSYPKNTIIIPFLFGLHRDTKFWTQAEKFVPERFINDPKIAKSTNYFPFGAGPRMCIGNNFAIAELCFFLSIFLKKFNIQRTGQVPELKALITLRPDKVVLNVEAVHSQKR